MGDNTPRAVGAVTIGALVVLIALKKTFGNVSVSVKA